jgi:hypothetical protein
MLPEHNLRTRSSSALERQVAMGLDRPGRHPDGEIDIEELIADGAEDDS